MNGERFTTAAERDARLMQLRGPGVEARVIGRSEEGRAIIGVVIGDGPVHVSLVAGAHADEPVGAQTLLELAEQPPEGVSLVIMPHMNPDGEACNRAWIDRWPDYEAYASQRVRELPGRDVEYGYPSMRVENAAVSRFLAEHGPFDLHVSLHGMGCAEGIWMLVHESWVERTAALRKKWSEAVREAGYELLDWDRKGEKGFTYIEPGFATTSSGAAMREHFRAKGDDATAAKFYQSSMEYVRGLNSPAKPDPLKRVTPEGTLCIVTELPLWIGEKKEAVPSGTAVRLQRLAIELGMETVREAKGGGVSKRAGWITMRLSHLLRRHVMNEWIRRWFLCEAFLGAVMLLVCAGCADTTGRAGNHRPDANIVLPLNLDEMVWVTKYNVCDDPKYGSFGRDVVLFYSRQTGEQVQGIDLLVYQDFSEGLVLAYKEYNGKSGYVDVTGRVVIPFQYDLAGLFHEGRADAYIKDSRDEYHAGLIDRSGKWIVPPKRYEKLGYFNEGRCAFRVGDQWGFLDASGKVVIKPQFRRPDLSSRFQIYHEAPIFHGGVAAVRDKDDHVSYIDRYGRPAAIKLPEGTLDIGDFHDGLAAFAVRGPGDTEDGDYIAKLYGYISIAGNVVVKPEYRTVSDFSEGLAAVSLNTREGFQDWDDPSLALRWDENGAWGYIDVAGKVVIPFQYPMVGRFSEGLARVYVTGKGWGFIDKTGKFAIPPRDWWVGDFHNGLAEMRESGIVKYIDRTGKVVITTDVTRAIF